MFYFRCPNSPRDSIIRAPRLYEVRYRTPFGGVGLLELLVTFTL